MKRRTYFKQSLHFSLLGPKLESICGPSIISASLSVGASWPSLALVGYSPHDEFKCSILAETQVT